MNFNQMNLGEMGHTLTQRMTSVVEGLKDKFAALYNTLDFEYKIKKLKECTPDEIGSVQMELVRMFKKCGVEYVKHGQMPSYYEDVLKNSNIPTPKKMSHRVYQSFLQEFVENPYPAPEEYIERIVDSKIDPEWKEDSLRLKILKTFIRDADALKAAGYKSMYIKQFVKEKTKKKSVSSGDMIDYLDDSIFDALKNADSHQPKKHGKYGLLKISEDLALGRFGNANVVREEIYLFAIVFELAYFTGDPEEIVTEAEKARDIEKMMFGDFYTNNIMRYISSGHEYMKSGGEQQNPTGKGINYKNYMEAIFLYFLRRWDLSIADKLKGVYKMAQEVHTEFLEKADISEEIPNEDEENRTQYYSTVFKENVLETEEKFKKFLIAKYDCSMPPETTPVFSVEAEQNTAKKEYEMLLEEASDFKLHDDKDVKWNLAIFADEIDLERIKKVQEDSEKGIIDFDNIDAKTKLDVLLYEVNRDIRKKKSQSELDRKIISRADILRLCYQMYIAMNDEEPIISFPEVYNDFSEMTNQHLQAALLRPINGRDLYDLILIYLAYCNINEEKFN